MMTMLFAAPNRELTINDPPKIISEIRKDWILFPVPIIKPKLSGELLVKCGNDKKWWPRRAMIRGGQLYISNGNNGHGIDAPQAFRLPLRHLSLKAGSLANSLSLCRGQNIILMLQTANEQSFQHWVKTIAIELIRQTPLEAVKYLDIFTFAECCSKCKDNIYINDWTFNNSKQMKMDDDNNNNNNNEEKTVKDLLKKCQNTESYVPVKEKLILFESLCKLGRKICSSEDVITSTNKTVIGTKRARSMHDLSTNYNSHIAVREICKYFENKNENDLNNFGTIGRVLNTKNNIHSSSHIQLDNIRKYQKMMNHKT